MLRGQRQLALDLFDRYGREPALKKPGRGVWVTANARPSRRPSRPTHSPRASSGK